MAKQKRRKRVPLSQPSNRGRERRQAARQREQEVLREESRRRAIHRGLVAGGILLAVGLAVILEVYIHRLNGEERALLARAPADAAAAGCERVLTVPPFPGGRDRTHIGGEEVRVMPPLADYPSTPPASGPHSSMTLPAGVYDFPPPVDRAIHSLEHASVIIWYDPSEASDAQLPAIKRFFERGDERSHVIVAPYSYPDEGSAGRLPSGTGIALVAWHHMMTCQKPSLSVAFEFVHSYRWNLYQLGAYEGDAPEKLAPI